MKRSRGIDWNVDIVEGSQKKVPSLPPAYPHFTTGEIFQNRIVVEPVRDGANSERLALLSWDGEKALINSSISLDAESYAPARIDPTILQRLTLPTQIAPYGSARKLLTDIARLLAEYSGLSEKPVDATCRWVLSSWFPEIPPAPGLSIGGPDTLAGRQFMRLLHCFCRHPLLLTDVNAVGLRTLPTEWSLCLLIVQRELSAELQHVLNSAKNSMGFVPRGGRLLDLHCTVATYSELGGVCSSGIIPGLEISIMPASEKLPVLDTTMQQQIANDFQAKLLRYRLENFPTVVTSRFELPELTPSMQEVAKRLTACTPEDPDLQAQVPEFLRTQDREVRSAIWINLDVVLIEAVLAFVHEGKEHSLYVAEIARAAELILNARGENRKLEPRAIGSRLSALGLKTEPRDRKGFRLILSGELSLHIHTLANNLSIPLNPKAVKSCGLCDSSGLKSRST